MKKQLLKSILLASAFTLGLTACAGSNTQESTGQYLDSSVITSKVKTQLLITKGIDSTDVNVDTYRDTVQLSGFVDTQTQKDLAAQTAAEVPGVNKVINNLVVKNPSSS